MRGGTQTQTHAHVKPPDGGTTKKPTAEQIRYAQLLGNEDTRRLQEQIRMVADVTGHSHDEVSVALHDCNFDTEQTINTLLEGRLDQSEWILPTSRKKKHQTAGPGIDNITPTSAPPTQTLSKPKQSRGGGRNSGKGRLSGDSTDPVKSNGLTNHDRPAVEGGRGRGSKEDRWGDRKPGGRGGGPRRGGRGGGRPGRPFRSRGNRFGSGNRNAHPTTTTTTTTTTPASSNGPTENGTEMWDIPDDSPKEKKTDWGDSPLVIDEWVPEEWTPLPSVEAPVQVAKEALFQDSEQSSSNSWADSKDDEQVSWGTGPGSTIPGLVTSSGADSQPNNSHISPESIDVSIIMSKLAQSSSPGKVSMPKTERVPRIPLPGENHSNHMDHINRLLDKAGVTVSFSSSPPSSEPRQTQPLPQRQPKQTRPKKSQRSQIPVQAVEMPGAMADSLDVQFGNLEFGGDSGSSIQEKEVKIKTRSNNDVSSRTIEEPRKSETSEIVSAPPPVEPKPDLTSLSSSLPINTPTTIAATTPASSSITALEESSPRHYQHTSPQERQQPLVNQGPPDPIPLPPQMESHMESVLQSKSVPSSIDRPKSPPSLQSVSIPQSLSSSSRNQNKVPHIPAVLSKESPLESRAYQHGVSQPSLARKEQLSTGSLGSNSYSSSSVSSNLSRSELPSSSEPLAPPPGVSIPHTANSTTAPSALTTVTMSNTGKPLTHTSKPSLPPGVLPINPALYGMQLHYPMGMPPYYDDLQRMQMPYYEMPSFAPQSRENLPGTYPGDQKFGRSDTSSPVPTSLNQAGSAGQPHLQQQQFINAAMPPFGYGGLAFYPPGTNPMMPGAFPAFTTQMYQMPAKTHASGSQFQPAFSGQHGSHSFSSGYDDLGSAHDFGKSGYHSSVTQPQSKSNAGSVVSSSSDLPGSTYKGQVGKFGDSKSFLAGTPPPALSHPMAGQHGHMGNFAHTGHPFMPMIPQAQQPHHPSLFHHQQQHHHMTHQHLDASQGGTTQRGQQVSGLKQSQNKGHQGSGGYPPFWSGQN